MRNFDMDMKVKEIENWLQTQAQLPQFIDKNLIKRFIYSMHGDLQRTKRMIDVHYRLRAKYHRVFMQRDPQDDISQKVLSAIDFIELPGKTQDNCKLLLYRFNNPRAAKFSFTEAIKVYFMMTDCQYATSFDEDIQGEIILIDMVGFNLQHLARIQLASLNIFLKFLQEAHPVRLKAIHFLNCPSYIEKFMKFSTKAQYFNKMYFHLLNKENCDKSLPSDMLPQEYGGEAGELANLRQFWLYQLHEKRKYLLDDTIW